MDGYRSDLSLLFRVKACLCALPLADIIETMRPLPVDAVRGAPRFVSGLAVIRGAPVPVIDLGQLFGEAGSPPTRFVTIAAGNRTIALAVGDVLGVQPLPRESLQPLPPLLQEVDAVAAIGTLDAELLVVLQGARLLPDDMWAALDIADPRR